ncbi:DUF222 domain-containing protein [Corynebacterium sp. H128]|uniref:HNH endonuclease signature motif containing protein n=1 Tax=Corynebacterium sp. H128 TaxID=3133427 RepID=UPI0030B4CB5F
MSHIVSAAAAIDAALNDATDLSNFPDLIDLKEKIARLETQLARGHEVHELCSAGVPRDQARVIVLRSEHDWRDSVPVAHQDNILGALQQLSAASTRRDAIYELAADAAEDYSPWQTLKYTRELVRRENERLSKDPFEAVRQRKLRLHSQDEHGGCRLNGYLPAAPAALMRSLMDIAFKHAADHSDADDLRTIDQRNADAFAEVLKMASSKRISDTGHASLIISATTSDEMDWRTKFATNTDIDLSLFDIEMLAGDRVSDYIVVHDAKGAAGTLYYCGRHANFWQRIALIAQELVCQYPGCDVHAGRCDVHHVHPWSKNRRTDLNNLALLCRKHHRLVDDDWFGAHIEKWSGQSHWVDENGQWNRNNSPAANRAAGSRIRSD